MLGVFVALEGDTMQIARAFRHVLRKALIQRKLAHAGPIQGIFGTRSQLDVVSLISPLLFGSELRKRSVTPGLSIGCISLPVLTLLLTRSPIASSSFLILAVAALHGIRTVSPEHKCVAQVALLVTTTVIGGVAWAIRTPMIDALSASSELNRHLSIWRALRLHILPAPGGGLRWGGLWREVFLLFYLPRRVVPDRSD